MSEESSNPVPRSWAWAKLDDLGDWCGGGTPSKSNTAFWSEGNIPWVSPKDMKAFEIFDSEDHVSQEAVATSATSLLPSETVLLVTRSGILRHTLPVALTRVPVTVNQDLKALMPERGLVPKYLAYGIRAFGQQILHSCVKDGTTVQSVEFSDLKHFQIPIAPSREQQRIADALDELLSELDAGVEALQRAQAKLALYRASVLKAAVQGDLTAEWRNQHPDAEPASVLLQRILVERRQRWEQEQLRKFKAAGKTPPANWKAKYKEPVAPDTTSLPELPKGWCWATFGQVAWSLRSGTAETSTRVPSQYPVLKSSAVRPGLINFEDHNFLNAEQSSNPENYIQLGDLLITRLSGSLEYVANCAVVQKLPNVPTQYPDRIFRAKVVGLVDADYLALCFQHRPFRMRLESAAKSTAGHQRISLSDLTDFAFPVPSLPEQREIVTNLDEAFSGTDHSASDMQYRIESSNSLRQSILRHAFTGQLVPQDPNDEPASVLLKRIAAEREARNQTRATPRKQTAKRQKREK